MFANIQFEEWHLGGTSEALVLRLGSIAVNAVLWTFLGSKAVREFWVRQSHPAGRAFEVILKEPVGSS